MTAMDASCHDSGSATTTTAVLTPELILGRILSFGRAPATHCLYASVSGHTRHPSPTRFTLNASPSPVLARVTKTVGGIDLARGSAALFHCARSSKKAHDARRWSTKRHKIVISKVTITETAVAIAAICPQVSVGSAGAAISTQYREGGAS